VGGTFTQVPLTLVYKGEAPSAHLQEGMEMEIKINTKYERETKNKFRFQEDAPEPVMGTLYVRKDLFDERPEQLEVTLRVVD